MNPSIHGIHHITAIAGDPARNLRFYRDVLGLRMVKKTVNFDDPFTYHLYYGDEAGSPGSILTFFPWVGMRRGRAGAGLVETVAYAIPSGALDYWEKRLREASVVVSERETILGEPGVRFPDPDGLQIALVEVRSPPRGPVWTAQAPVEHAIRGFHGAAERVRDPAATDAFLTGVLGFVREAKEGRRQRYRTPGPGTGHFDLVADPDAPPAVSGTGTVHHIAFATADIAANESWRARLTSAGAQVSPVMNRKYFHSIYFREPGGVLFEMATLGPGFAVDEPAEALGRELKLPEMHEPLRERIEAKLPALPT